jgi:hypothetical protein
VGYCCGTPTPLCVCCFAWWPLWHYPTGGTCHMPVGGWMAGGGWSGVGCCDCSKCLCWITSRQPLLCVVCEAAVLLLGWPCQGDIKHHVSWSGGKHTLLPPASGETCCHGVTDHTPPQSHMCLVNSSRARLVGLKYGGLSCHTRSVAGRGA